MIVQATENITSAEVFVGLGDEFYYLAIALYFFYYAFTFVQGPITGVIDMVIGGIGVIAPEVILDSAEGTQVEDLDESLLGEMNYAVQTFSFL